MNMIEPSEAYALEEFQPPYPWDVQMTLCIAAACCLGGDDPKIVVSSDWLASGPLGSTDTLLKQKWVGPGWLCLTSGLKPDIQAELTLLRAEIKAEGTIDDANFSRVMKEAMRKRKKEKADQFIAAKYGLTYDEFLNTGKAKLPEDRFRRATEEIEFLELGAELILVGFDPNETPYIGKMGARCECAVIDDCAAIGNGAPIATAILLSRQQRIMYSLPQTLYNVYEAIKYAERVPGVGNDHTISILSKDGTREVLNKDGMSWLDGLYKKHGPKPIPMDSISLPANAYCEKL